MHAPALPDLVSDSCTDAARRLGITMERLFLKAAENCRNGHGFSNNGEVGERWYNIWKRSGYNCLPPACKEFVLSANNGEITVDRECPECHAKGSCPHHH